MKPLFWAAVVSGPLALGLWWLAGLSPALTEAWYSRGLYPLLMAPWSRLTGLVAFPVAPLVVAALTLVCVAGLFVAPLRMLAGLGAAASLLMAWFVLGWGLNYQRVSWAENHGLKASGGTVAELGALAEKLAAQAAPLREKASAAGPFRWKDFDPRRISEAFERSGDPLLAGSYGSPKSFAFLNLMSWLGIAGICIPHTGEPLVNTGPDNWLLPFTAAHEAAHLRGWAREDEANFLAFWVLHNSADPALAYAAYGAALLYTASALGEAGPLGQQEWSRVRAQLPAGILEDWKVNFDYWDRFRGPVREAASAVNDLYLKSQGQKDGIKSYGRMVDLLLAVEGSASAPEAR